MTVMNNEDPADPSVHERQDAYRCIAPACKPLGCSDCNCAVPADVYAALGRAFAEAERERDSHKAGNTELLELLMKLHAGEHTAILPRVREILVGAGLVGADNTLNWSALETRKPQRITWAQAVNECVTDPEERARLLALGDDSGIGQ